MPRFPKIPSALRRPSALAASWLFIAMGIESAQAGELRAGAAAVAITPPLGTPMAGYYYAREAEGVHDDLHAKTLVVEKDGVVAALVSLDLIRTTRPLVTAARAAITKKTGIPSANVTIIATHAHTGPSIPSWSLREAELAKHPAIVRYLQDLPQLIAQSVDTAFRRLTPAVASVAKGRLDGVAFNRRYHMRDGSVGWNPGKLNPGIARPAGPVDPELSVLYLETSDHKPIASLVSFAIHLDTTGGTRFSADFPHVVARTLGAVKGPEMVTIFAAGASGNVNHFDVSSAADQTSPAEAARIGALVSAEVLRAYQRLEPLAIDAILVKSAMVALALPRVTPEAVGTARKLLARQQQAKNSDAKFIDIVQAYKVLDVDSRKGKPLEVEVHTVTLGHQAAWVSLPGEIFVELGLAIKQASPFKHSFIGTHANGSVGYVPNRTAYPQGAYEVVSARCGVGSGELLVDTALGLLRGLYRPPAAGSTVSSAGSAPLERK